LSITTISGKIAIYEWVLVIINPWDESTKIVRIFEAHMELAFMETSAYIGKGDYERKTMWSLRRG